MDSRKFCASDNQPMVDFLRWFHQDLSQLELSFHKRQDDTECTPSTFIQDANNFQFRRRLTESDEIIGSFVSDRKKIISGFFAPLSRHSVLFTRKNRACMESRREQRDRLSNTWFLPAPSTSSKSSNGYSDFYWQSILSWRKADDSARKAEALMCVLSSVFAYWSIRSTRVKSIRMTISPVKKYLHTCVVFPLLSAPSLYISLTSFVFLGHIRASAQHSPRWLLHLPVGSSCFLFVSTIDLDSFLQNRTAAGIWVMRRRTNANWSDGEPKFPSLYRALLLPVFHLRSSRPARTLSSKSFDRNSLVTWCFPCWANSSFVRSRQPTNRWRCHWTATFTNG